MYIPCKMGYFIILQSSKLTVITANTKHWLDIRLYMVHTWELSFRMNSITFSTSIQEGCSTSVRDPTSDVVCAHVCVYVCVCVCVHKNRNFPHYNVRDVQERHACSVCANVCARMTCSTTVRDVQESTSISSC